MGIFRKTLHKSRGVTLLELMLALTLLLVAIALGYNIFHLSQKAYNDSQEKWIAQSNARQAMDFIKQEMGNAYFAEINYTGSQLDGDKDFYLDASGKLIFKQSGATEKTITDSKYAIVFERAKSSTWNASEPEKNRVNDTVTITIHALNDGGDVLYTVSSAVHLANMSDTDMIAGPYSGSKIRYQRTGEGGTIPTPNSVTRCFIATAAYGGSDAAPVMVLRRFRDQVLLKSEFGKEIVDMYYLNSPRIAELIDRHAAMRIVTGVLLLPIVLLASILMHPYLFLFFMGSVILCMSFIRRYRKNQLPAVPE